LTLTADAATIARMTIERFTSKDGDAAGATRTPVLLLVGAMWTDPELIARLLGEYLR
jgi:hypothetical protein